MNTRIPANDQRWKVGARTEFTPEDKRRSPKPGEYEIMKGRGDRQKWFYVDSLKDAETLVALGRNWGFPTGVTRGPHVPKHLTIDE